MPISELILGCIKDINPKDSRSTRFKLPSRIPVSRDSHHDIFLYTSSSFFAAQLSPLHGLRHFCLDLTSHRDISQG